MTTGILALQGSFQDHQKSLDLINKKHILIKCNKDLKYIDSLIIPIWNSKEHDLSNTIMSSYLCSNMTCAKSHRLLRVGLLYTVHKSSSSNS